MQDDSFNNEKPTPKPKARPLPSRVLINKALEPKETRWRPGGDKFVIML